jgi:hypothetical protein
MELYSVKQFTNNSYLFQEVDYQKTIAELGLDKKKYLYLEEANESNSLLL